MSHNHWNRQPDKHVPIVPTLLILFAILFILGICQEAEQLDETNAFQAIELEK